MSKFLKVSNGNYTVQVQDGGTITFNTGDELGQVIITGDLLVRGDTTTVQSENLTVRDNIIVVNDGETGAGVTLDTAGIKVDRGTNPDAFLIFDENVSWRDPVTETTKNGGIVFRDELGSLLGIRANSISTGGGDLYLINSGSGVISVTGTTNYELNITDDDHITNKKYVDDAITTAFATVFLTQIGDGVVDPTTVKILDNETTGNQSLIEFKVDNNFVAGFYPDRFELGDIRIIGTQIETISSDSDLVLSAPGSGSIVLDDIVEIRSVPGVDDLTVLPTFPSDGAKLYITNQSTGGTGIFFANAEQTRDELISNNRSLVYSMVF